MKNLRIIMYHYIRDIERSRYPKIKARKTEEFKNQLAYLAQHYTPVTAQEVIAAFRDGYELPHNAVWLTFDDGYIDHYATVFPLLYERGWQGSFFAPSKAILERKLLDVNKVHLILATIQDAGRIVATVKEHVEANATDLKSTFAEFWATEAIASRFDSAEVMFVKNMLQHALPPDIRMRVIGDLFTKFVSTDECAIASEFYMSEDQIKLMMKCGMFFGAHGHDHFWMDRLSRSEQENEVQLSKKFLSTIGAETVSWIMCYPYGAYNASLLDILNRSGCAIGLTTRPAVVDLDRDEPLELPRLDTNDFLIK